MGELRALVAHGCPQCVDLAFALAWMDFLSRRPREAYTVTEDALPLIKVSSGIVERQHPLGQELRPKKSAQIT